MIRYLRNTETGELLMFTADELDAYYGHLNDDGYVDVDPDEARDEIVQQQAAADGD